MDVKVNHVQGVEIWKGMFAVDKGQCFLLFFCHKQSATATSLNKRRRTIKRTISARNQDVYLIVENSSSIIHTAFLKPLINKCLSFFNYFLSDLHLPPTKRFDKNVDNPKFVLNGTQGVIEQMHKLRWPIGNYKTIAQIKTSN